MTTQIQSILGGNASVILLGLKSKNRCMLLHGRVKKKEDFARIVQDVLENSTYWCCLCGELSLGSVWKCECSTELTYSVLLSHHILKVFFEITEESGHKISQEAPYLLLTVSLEQIFHINTKKAKHVHLLPNCPLRWEVCSPLFRSLSFEFSYHLAPHPFCFSCWFTACQRQLTLTVWPQQRIIKGSIKGLPQARRIHREELPVQGPLMSHTGLGSEGLGTMPRLDQRSQFKLRERAKRITGNCISKGPSKKFSLEKKERVSKGKQLYLESTGTKVAKVSDQGQQQSWFWVQNKEEWESQKDEGRETRQGDNEAH